MSGHPEPVEETVTVDSLLLDPRNARVHDERNLSTIKGSLTRFGQQKRIVVDGTGKVIAGNGTLMAARSLGWKEIRISRTPLTGKEAMAFALVDNKSSDLSTFNDAEVLAQLAELGADSVGLGWDDAELARMVSESEETTSDPDDAPEKPEPADTWVKPGDLFELGAHRLLCGDATKDDQVARLMNGEKASMVVVDPPYGMLLNVDFDHLLSHDPTHRKTGRRHEPIVGDGRDFDRGLIDALFRNFSACKEMFIFGADYFSDLIPERREGSWLVWDKRCEENMDKVSGNTFELCWSRVKHKRLVARILWSGHHGMQSDDTKKRVHPAQKPTALIKWLFENWGDAGDLVVDLYSGSGTVLMACAQTARRCFACEISPAYAQVTIERWEKFVKGKAKKIG